MSTLHKLLFHWKHLHYFTPTINNLIWQCHMNVICSFDYLNLLLWPWTAMLGLLWFTVISDYYSGSWSDYPLCISVTCELIYEVDLSIIVFLLKVLVYEITLRLNCSLNIKFIQYLFHINFDIYCILLLLPWPLIEIYLARI